MCNKPQEVKAEPPPPLTTAPAQGTVWILKSQILFSPGRDYLLIPHQQIIRGVRELLCQVRDKASLY